MDAHLVMYVFGIALTLSAVLLSHFGSAEEIQFYDSEFLDEIEQEFDCEQLREKLRDESPELLLECKNIMNSDIVRRTKAHMLNLTREEMLELKATLHHKNPKFSSRRKRSTKCPVVNDDFLARHADDVGMRSLSPYREGFRGKVHRFPRFILESECLCDGCINPDTGRETLNLVSKAIEVKQPVIFYSETSRTHERGVEDVRVGCTCIQPNLS